MIRLVAAALVVATPALAAERNFPVGGFDKLALAGSPDVSVVTGRSVAVNASGDAEALDRLDVYVADGTLHIEHKRSMWNWSWRDHERVHFTVSVPMLHAVDVAGSGDVTVDRVRAPAFAGNISGSGSLTLAALEADRVAFNVAGSGTVSAAGRCGEGAAKIAGSGDLKLGGLRCTTFSGSVAGSGNIDAFATQTATLATMGSGDIRVAGGARCTTSTAGSGKVRCS